MSREKIQDCHQILQETHDPRKLRNIVLQNPFKDPLEYARQAPQNTSKLSVPWQLP